MRAPWSSRKVGVLLGGNSKEREISIKTGTAIADALKRKGYRVMTIDCRGNVAQQIREADMDVAFIALHGPFGEDGQVQQLLEDLHIPYTGSGPQASALAMDKAVLSPQCRAWGFRVPAESIFEGEVEEIDSFLFAFRGDFPVIVKPSREGSSINLSFVQSRSDLKPAIERALRSDSKILVQQFICGKEVTISILDGEVLPSIEIVPHKGLYDYEAKYTKGKTDYSIPARLPETTLKELGVISKQIYNKVGAEGFARIDFIVDEKNTPWFLELNTIPGMTETSLVPKAAKAAGILFDDLCERILNAADCKSGECKSAGCKSQGDGLK